MKSQFGKINFFFWRSSFLLFCRQVGDCYLLFSIWGLLSRYG